MGIIPEGILQDDALNTTAEEVAEVNMEDNGAPAEESEQQGQGQETIGANHLQFDLLAI